MLDELVMCHWDSDLVLSVPISINIPEPGLSCFGGGLFVLVHYLLYYIHVSLKSRFYWSKDIT